MMAISPQQISGMDIIPPGKTPEQKPLLLLMKKPPSTSFNFRGLAGVRVQEPVSIMFRV